MRRRASLVVLVLAAAGCGAKDSTLSPACTDGAPAIAHALQRAPAPVRLPGGTALSQCMAQADTDAELESFGALATQVADDLAARGDAVRLGYLIGATRRGAAKGNGVGLELEHRLETSARRLAGGAQTAELERGLQAGARTG